MVVMVTCNHNGIDYSVEMPVIMKTFQLPYGYNGKNSQCQ